MCLCVFVFTISSRSAEHLGCFHTKRERDRGRDRERQKERQRERQRETEREIMLIKLN